MRKKNQFTKGAFGGRTKLARKQENERDANKAIAAQKGMTPWRYFKNKLRRKRK